MEAVMLVGGQGTRLRPLTENVPKPMLPVANRPCVEHQISRARDAGVTRIVLSTSHRAEVFETYFGAGENFGIEIVYVTEESPLGTGGAIRNAVQALRSAPDAPVVIFNGDVLSGHDIRAQVDAFEKVHADVSLHLIEVDDPRPFGMVPTDANGRVVAFLEKPQTPEEIVTHQVNAGCYVFRREVIDSIPADCVVSVERETFPALLSADATVVGYVESAYWLDLGTPLAFMRGSRDLVRGLCPSALVAHPGESLIDASASVADSAVVGGGAAVAAGATIGERATVTGSVILAGAVVEAGATVRDSIIGQRARVGSSSQLVGVVVGDGADIGADNQLGQGEIVWTDAHIPHNSAHFSD